MSIINSLLARFFGNKSERDIKEVQPIIEKIKSFEAQAIAFSNDELRNHTAQLRARIQEAVKPLELEIDDLKVKIEDDTINVDDREKMYERIKAANKEIDATIARVLDEILPEAFTIVKETARRFTNNETIEVTANDFDRELAIDHDFVTIDGDKAIYQNKWMAGGNITKWEMVHYDVQLI